MVGPSSHISKLLLSLFGILLLWYVYMDVNLYLRIQNYPIDKNYHINLTENNAVLVNKVDAVPYETVTWIDCKINPLCDVTVKALMLDHTNHYVFAPLATASDTLIGFSKSSWITPNMISFSHVFVALLAAKFIATDDIIFRRIGVILFQFRTFLDDLDGHVARVKKHIRGERSEIGTMGYYVDGICDGLGCIALMIGVFLCLKNNPPRRGYTPLQPILPTENKIIECGILYKMKITSRKLMNVVLCFSGQLLLSSTAWNRYIALYQDMLERDNLPLIELTKQDLVFRSNLFFAVCWMWRVINVHSLLHCLLFGIFCDKMWGFLRGIQHIGFVVLLCAICLTEMHVLEAQNFIFNSLTGNSTTL